MDIKELKSKVENILNVLGDAPLVFTSNSFIGSFFIDRPNCIYLGNIPAASCVAAAILSQENTENPIYIICTDKEIIQGYHNLLQSGEINTSNLVMLVLNTGDTNYANIKLKVGLFATLDYFVFPNLNVSDKQHLINKFKFCKKVRKKYALLEK